MQTAKTDQTDGQPAWYESSSGANLVIYHERDGIVSVLFF